MLRTQAMLHQLAAQGRDGWKPISSLRLFVAALALTLTVIAGSRAAEADLSAAQSPLGPTTLGQILRIARAENPRIRAAEYKYRAMLERPSQEGTLPDPSVGVRYHNEQFGRTTFGSSEFSYLELSTEQEVPFPGKLGLRESVARRDAELERAMRDSTVVSVLAQVVIAFTDLNVADRSAEILDESVGVLDTIVKQTGQSYSVGTAAQQDVLRATLERDALQERIAMLALQRTTAEAAINALLNRSAEQALPKTSWTDRVGDLEPLDELSRRLADRAPELRAAAEEVLKSEDILKLAERSYLPDFTAMGAYANKNGLFAEWELGLRLSVPVYFWRKQRAAVAEAAYSRSAAEHALRTSRVTLESHLRELHAIGATALRLINLYGETLIPEASLTLKSARASYSVGKVDFLTTLNAFNALLEYRMRYTEEVGQFRRAVAQIAPLIGEPPTEAPKDTTP